MLRSDCVLESGNGTRLVDPPGTQIRQALLNLHGARDPFVILEGEDGRLAQAHGSHIDGFLLEHRPLRGAVMWRVDSSPVPLDVAMGVFGAMLPGEERPLGDLTWEFEFAPATDPEGDTPKRWASLWIAAAGILLLLGAMATGQSAWASVGMGVLSVFCFATGVDGFRTGVVETGSWR